MGQLSHRVSLVCMLEKMTYDMTQTSGAKNHMPSRQVTFGYLLSQYGIVILVDKNQDSLMMFCNTLIVISP